MVTLGLALGILMSVARAQHQPVPAWWPAGSPAGAFWSPRCAGAGPGFEQGVLNRMTSRPRARRASPT